MMTPGRPGSVAPATEYPGARRRATYHTDGARSARCGSLARIGIPVVVREPASTHELLPRPGSSGSRAPARAKERSSLAKKDEEIPVSRVACPVSRLDGAEAFHSESRRIVGVSGT